MRYEIRLNDGRESLVDHADFDGAIKWLIAKAAEYTTVQWMHMGVAGIVLILVINPSTCYKLVELSFPKQ